MGNKLAVMKIKSNDLVMNLAPHRYSLIVHTEGLCAFGQLGRLRVGDI